MRTIKELLQLLRLVLSNPIYFDSGLCWSVLRLYLNDIISSEEKWLLWNYISKNRPSKYSSIGAFISRKSTYYWPKWDMKPRIKWLDHHIKKLS